MDHAGVTAASMAEAKGGDSETGAARYVLLGPPASGKGTQGRRLAERFGLRYLSTGALLRREMADQTALGLEAKTYLDAGNYLPDRLMETILDAWLAQNPSGWVLDGFPRTLSQALWLDERLANDGGLTAAIALEVPVGELEQRVTGRLECSVCAWTTSRQEMGGDRVCPRCGGSLAGREDDGIKNFRSRHDSYEALTVPAIHHYRGRQKLVSIDGSAAPDEVFFALLDQLSLFSHGQANQDSDQNRR